MATLKVLSRCLSMPEPSWPVSKFRNTSSLSISCRKTALANSSNANCGKPLLLKMPSLPLGLGSQTSGHAGGLAGWLLFFPEEKYPIPRVPAPAPSRLGAQARPTLPVNLAATPSARRHAGPALEGPGEGGGFGESHQFGDFADAQTFAGHQAGGVFPPQGFLDLAQGGAFVL